MHINYSLTGNKMGVGNQTLVCMFIMKDMDIQSAWLKLSGKILILISHLSVWERESRGGHTHTENMSLIVSKHFESLRLSSDLPDGLRGVQRRFDWGRPEPLQHTLSFAHKLNIAHKLSLSHSSCDHDGTDHHHLCCRLLLCQVSRPQIRAPHVCTSVHISSTSPCGCESGRSADLLFYLISPQRSTSHRHPLVDCCFYFITILYCIWRKYHLRTKDNVTKRDKTRLRGFYLLVELHGTPVNHTILIWTQWYYI